MKTQDLTNNKERIIKNIRFQITLCTNDNIKGVMNKMIAMLPQFENEKATMKNIDKLTAKATASYIKYDKVNTSIQNDKIDANLEIKRNQSLPSSLQY